jgi:hypothetical protein
MTGDQLTLWHRIDAFGVDGGPCEPVEAARPSS